MTSRITKEEFVENKTVLPESGCWLWNGTINKDGYGVVQFERKFWLVHRLAYKLLVKEPTLSVLHKQGCWYKHCFNPEHLYEGTQKENMRDRDQSGRNPLQHQKDQTHCKYGHEFTEENTYIHPNGSRHCKACDTERHRLKYGHMPKVKLYG